MSEFFFHEKMNFISSSQRVIFFLLHRYECFENKKKWTKTKEKQRNDVSESSLVKIWKISDSYSGCSFVWKIRVVFFSVKHSYLCNKIIYNFLTLINFRNSFHFLVPDRRILLRSENVSNF